jgi:hypothetical protein
MFMIFAHESLRNLLLRRSAEIRKPLLPTPERQQPSTPEEVDQFAEKIELLRSGISFRMNAGDNIVVGEMGAGAEFLKAAPPRLQVGNEVVCDFALGLRISDDSDRHLVTYPVPASLKYLEASKSWIAKVGELEAISFVGTNEDHNYLAKEFSRIVREQIQNIG